MGIIHDQFAEVFRDFAIAGVPGSGAHKPPKVDVRALGLLIEEAIEDSIDNAVTVSSPEKFGAVALEDGGSPDVGQSARFIEALESGEIIDCNGKNYAIGGSVNPADGTVAGLRNGKFKRTPATQGEQSPMFNLTGQPWLIVENNLFHMGDVENTGTNDDSSRIALAVGSNSPTRSTWLPGIRVRGNRVTGGGNGTSLFCRGTVGIEVAGNRIYDRIVAGTGITNDAQNGIDISFSLDAEVRGNHLNGLFTRISGNLQRIYSRGILFTESENSLCVLNRLRNIDQCIDYSGGITASLPFGNSGIVCMANQISDFRTFGVKLANCARNGVVALNHIRRFGWAGVVVSPQSGAWLAGNADKATSNLQISHNYIMDPADYYNRTDCIGVWVTQRPDFPGYPRDIQIFDNTVHDTQNSGRLLYGVANDDGDGAHNLVAGAINPEASGNRVRGLKSGGKPTYGIAPYGTCIVTGDSNLPVTSNTWTSVGFNVEIVDAGNMHSNVVSAELITALVDGWYEFEFSHVWGAEGAGYRKARILRSGGAIPGGEFTVLPVSGAETTVSGSVRVYMAVGQTIRTEAFQSSPGTISLVRASSQQSLRLVEQW